MDFIRYAERAASLVNADLPDEAALHEHLADRAWLHGSVEAADDSPDAERALIASERLRRSLEVIGRMTEKRRTIFLLHRIEGLSYAQIARRTGVSVKTVEKQMTAAMAFLSREMSEK